GGIKCGGFDHAGAGDARRDESESAGERQIVPAGADLARALGASPAAGAGDGRPAARGSERPAGGGAGTGRTRAGGTVGAGVRGDPEDARGRGGEEGAETRQ